MTLIAILLAIVSERYWHPFSTKRLFSPLLSWREFLAVRCRRMGWFDGPVGVLLCVAPAVLVIALLQSSLAGTDGFLMGLLALIFYILVLVACIGEQRFGAQARHYMEILSTGDLVAVADYMKSVSSRCFSTESLRQLNHDFLGLLLIRMNERVLALLFWFVVLGPMGAILYRSVAQLRESNENSLTEGLLLRDESQGNGYRQAILRLKGIMDWLPIRLTALTYAVIGSFTDAIHVWRRDSPQMDDDWVKVNDRLLLNVGIAALQIQAAYEADGVNGDTDMDVEHACEHVRVVRALSKRTLLAWVTLLALMTLAGWLS